MENEKIQGIRTNGGVNSTPVEPSLIIDFYIGGNRLNFGKQAASAAYFSYYLEI